MATGKKSEEHRCSICEIKRWGTPPENGYCEYCGKYTGAPYKGSGFCLRAGCVESAFKYSSTAEEIRKFYEPFRVREDYEYGGCHLHYSSAEVHPKLRGIGTLYWGRRFFCKRCGKEMRRERTEIYCFL